MKIIKEINRGGVGKVEKVRLDNGNIVARKVFSPSPEFISSPDEFRKLKERFKREILIQKELDGEFFVPIFEYDFDSDEPWFTMPLAERTFG